MNVHTKRFLYWAPRILCILFALFLSIFAMDVFDQGRPPGEVILALLIHLVPVYLVIIVLAIAWKHEWFGAVLFTILALAYLLATGGKMHWGAYLTISGTMVLLAVLFLLNWLYRSELRLR
jgi:hypothetical protein